jgi:hypothetical protein
MKRLLKLDNSPRRDVQFSRKPDFRAYQLRHFAKTPRVPIKSTQPYTKEPPPPPTHSIPMTQVFPGTPVISPLHPDVYLKPVTCKLSTLPNGIRVISTEIFSQSSALIALVDCGTIWEDDLTHGCSHVLERMAFKVISPILNFYLAEYQKYINKRFGP